MSNPDQFTDEFGREYFTCAVCGETFISNPDFPHEERQKEMEANFPPAPPGDPIRSVCDGCYRKGSDFIEELRRGRQAAIERREALVGRTVHYVESNVGIIPEPSGHVISLDRDGALAFFGLPPDGKETPLNQYVQIVAPPAEVDHYIIAPEQP